LRFLNGLWLEIYCQRLLVNLKFLQCGLFLRGNYTVQIGNILPCKGL